jgi:hypothetical protein
MREIEESACWLESLVEAKVVPPEKLEGLRKEIDELTAIFVRILTPSKSTS